MIAAAAITAVLGHWVDTGVLLAAVIINVIIGFIQEGKAETALDSIRAMLSPHATVIRDGTRYEIDAAGLVPGDLVLLASGDRVPADIRLISVKELQVEEAALTGESLPVRKRIETALPDTLPGDRYGMAFPAHWSFTVRPAGSSWQPAAQLNWAKSIDCWKILSICPPHYYARSITSVQTGCFHTGRFCCDFSVGNPVA